MSYDPTAAGTTADEPLTLPTDRRTGCPFDPPAELTALSDKPLRRMRYADGHVGWLVTGHATARAILADPRLSSRYELLHLPVPIKGVSGELPPAPVGDISGLDAPESRSAYGTRSAGRVRRWRGRRGDAGGAVEDGGAGKTRVSRAHPGIRTGGGFRDLAREAGPRACGASGVS